MPSDPINRHRGLGAGELPRRWLRRDEQPQPDDLVEDDQLDVEEWNDESFDGYWEASNSGSAVDFVLQRLSTEVLWSVGTPRPWPEVGDPPSPEASPPIVGVAADALPDALFAHVARFVSAAAVTVYLEAPTGRSALAELSVAHRAQPGLARWFAERPGAASVAVLLAPFWIRPVRAWTAPATDDVDTIGRALIEHLFVRYPVPATLFEPWRSPVWPVLKWVLWLVAIGQGASLRRLGARFDWEIPSGFAHHLSQAPPTLRATEAVMWAEVRRLGGTDVDARRVLQHAAYALDPTSGPPLPDVPLAAPPPYPHPRLEPPEPGEELASWRATIGWLIRHHAELTDEDTQVVLDWAMHRHTEDLARAVPVEARFSWRGRTAPATLATARAYADELERAGRAGQLRWPARGWDWDGPTEGGTWTARELTTSERLAAESAAMRHCVATYAYRCVQGVSAIFSLCVDGRRRATVELDPSTRRVVQARGGYNRACTDEELAVITRWLAATAPDRPAGHPEDPAAAAPADRPRRNG